MNKEYITVEKKELNEDEGTIVGIASKAIVDRDNELILGDAWKLDNYRKNPVLMLAHDLQSLPIGKCLWVKNAGGELRFKAKFASTPRGQEVYQLFLEGCLTSFSVGFKANPGGYVDNPTDAKYKGIKRVYRDVELLEISCVAIPANNSAIVEAVKSGKIQTKELKNELIEIFDIKDIDEDVIEIKDGISSDNWIEVPVEEASTHKACKKKSVTVSKKEGIEGSYCEDDQKMVSYMFDPEKWDEEKAKKYIEDNHEKAFNISEGKIIDIESKSYFDDSGDLVVVKIEKTDDYIHVPVPDEEGMHKDHKIRTIDISKEKGIKGLYCVDDKKLINFVFDREDKYGWDVNKAKKWVNDYSKEKSFDIIIEGDEITVKEIVPEEKKEVIEEAKAIPQEETIIKAMEPMKDEEMQVFMDRCMSDETMMSEHGEEGPRKESCQLAWDKMNGEKEKSLGVVTVDLKMDNEMVEIIKSLQSQIAELKCGMESMKIPAPEPAQMIGTSTIETKTADSSQNPSLYDITCAINCSLNDPKNRYILNPEGDMNCYFSVIDIYTTEFPGGHVVYSENCPGEACEYYQIDYVYDLAERKVSFSGSPQLMLQSWVVDRYGEQEPIEKSVENVIVKEGRVLSTQNRQMLMDCIGKMQETMSAMQGLMDSTEKNVEPVPKPAMTVEDLFKENEPAVTKEAEDTFEFDEPEIEKKELDSIEIDDSVEIDEDSVREAVSNAMRKSFKIDIKDAVKETIARRLGRAVL